MGFKKIIIDREEYRLINNVWVDEGYIVPPLSVIKQIYRKIFENREELSDEEILNYSKELKKYELYGECYDQLKYLVEKAADTYSDRVLICRILPIMTSCLRFMKMPEKAIECFDETVAKFGQAVISVPALVSVAAAYCDIGNLGKAREYANRAYSLDDDYDRSGELMALYARLKSLEG